MTTRHRTDTQSTDTQSTDTTHGTTPSGVVITDELVARLAERAEAGFDVEELKPRMRPGRPPMGSARAEIVNVRLDPELLAALDHSAQTIGVRRSEIVRDALRAYFASSPKPPVVRRPSRSRETN